LSAAIPPESDLFLPILRENYNDVYAVFVVGAALAASTRFPWAIAPCLLALPAGWILYFTASGHAALVDLPALFFTLGSLALLFFIDNRPTWRTPP
jgi:hypothetical protein